METIFDTSELRETIARWRRNNETIGFVPTMGNLHDGHISLLDKAREISDRTVVSIFVNPIQFGKGEDYANYPSTLTQDGEKLERHGADVLFAPNLRQLYPGGMEEDTRVTVPGLSSILCGKFRPGHFSGVATVVTKLLFSVLPDIALFGEKDYQQLLVIKRMVSDLCIPVEILGQPIIRETDGLAMSSRNSYLNSEERAKAPIIFKTLNSVGDALHQGARDFRRLENEAEAALREVGLKPEYVSIRRHQDLGLPESEETKYSVLAAAWLGSARLIDNIQVDLAADENA